MMLNDFADNKALSLNSRYGTTNRRYHTVDCAGRGGTVRGSNPRVPAAPTICARVEPGGHIPWELIPGLHGMKVPKWLSQLALSPEQVLGYWAWRGWSEEAVIHTLSRIDTPREGEVLQAGTEYAVAGVADAGGRGIQDVQVSTDRGDLAITDMGTLRGREVLNRRSSSR